MSATAFHLRTDRWKSVQIPVVPSPGYTAGDFFFKENLVCIAPEDYATGVKGVGIYQAEKIYVPKPVGTGEDIAVGDKVYLNTATGKVSKNSATGRYFVGYATEAATLDATGVEIDFNGEIAGLAGAQAS